MSLSTPAKQILISFFEQLLFEHIIIIIIIIIKLGILKIVTKAASS